MPPGVFQWADRPIFRTRRKLCCAAESALSQCSEVAAEPLPLPVDDPFATGYVDMPASPAGSTRLKPNSNERAKTFRAPVGHGDSKLRASAVKPAALQGIREMRPA